MGLPHAIAVTTADVTDRDGTIQMILLNQDKFSHVEKFLVDGGYSGERFANQAKNICGAQVEVVKRNELHKFVVLPRQWVVERLFGWLDKFRRRWKNCERKFSISAQILTFALIAILIRRFYTGSNAAMTTRFLSSKTASHGCRVPDHSRPPGISISPFLPLSPMPDSPRIHSC